MKKLLSVLLTLCLLAGLCVSAVSASEPGEPEEIAAVSAAVPPLTLTKNFKKLGILNNVLGGAQIFAEGAVGEVTFYSSNPNRVTVDGDGNVALNTSGLSDGGTPSFSGTVKITAVTDAGQEAFIYVDYSVFYMPWYVWAFATPFLLIFGLFDMVFVLGYVIVSIPIDLFKGFINLFR